MQVVGHRGARGLVPENTIVGFEKAIELGCELTECDVRFSSDGYLVILHDDTVDRTTNGTGQVADLTFAELRALDAGDGEQIPTFDEVLETIQGRIGLLCELKGPGTAAGAVEAVRRHELVADVIFTCFDFRQLRDVRALGKELRVGGILSKRSVAALDELTELKAVSVGVQHHDLTAEFVRECQDRGFHIRGWNPNTIEDIQRVVDMHPDGVSSDRPDLAIEVVRGRA